MAEELNIFGFATQGIFPGTTPIQISLQGWVVIITEEEVDTDIVKTEREGLPNKKYHKRKKKKISVKIEKDGQTFSKDKFYSNLKVSTKDVKITILENKQKPQIKITLIK